jgi:hypothetical protein
MVNYPKVMRDFFRAPENAKLWTETNPDLKSIWFPYMPSRTFLLRAENIGRSMIWFGLAQTRHVPVLNQWTEAWPVVNVFCWARAKSNSEDHVTLAQQRAQNMKDMILSIVQRNWQSFLPAWQARPTSGERELPELNIDPISYTAILPIEFWQED